MRAKFNKGLRVSGPITMILAVSMENKRQTQEDLAAFFDLVKRHNQKGIMIKNVKIILSCYLQRFYVGEQKAIEINTTWKAENEQYLKKSSVPCEVSNWQSIYSLERYNDSKIKIANLYEHDSAFQNIVNGLAKQHSFKAGNEAAANYLLEECAAFLSLDGHVAYPSTSLNGAVAYALEKFNSQLVFHGYMLYEEPEKKVNPTLFFKQSQQPAKPVDAKNLFTASMELARLMAEYGICDPENQVKCFNDILNITEQYKNRENNENGHIKARLTKQLA